MKKIFLFLDKAELAFVGQLRSQVQALVEDVRKKCFKAGESAQDALVREIRALANDSMKNN